MRFIFEASKSFRIKELFFAGLFLIAFSTMLAAQTASLTIRISGLEEIEGTVQIGLYDADTAFPKIDLEFISLRVNVDSTEVQHTIPDLPFGEYAIAIYHDVNDDGKCNRNWIGIPTEDYGFSNNVRVRFSAPTFEKTKFELYEDQEILVILNR